MKTDMVKRALRLYGRCVLSTVMGTFMYFSIGIITHAMTQDSKTLSAGASFIMHLVVLIVQAFLTFSIVYAEMWKQGDKDGGPVMFGGAEGDPWKGLKVGLLSAMPAFVGYLLIISEKLIGFWPSYMQFYRASNFALYPIIVWTLGERADVPASACSWTGILLSVIPAVVIVLVAAASYYIGYRQLTFGQKLMYKNGRKDRNKLR